MSEPWAGGELPTAALVMGLWHWLIFFGGEGGARRTWSDVVLVVFKVCRAARLICCTTYAALCLAVLHLDLLLPHVHFGLPRM
jgi:hypothetical protein